MTNGKNTRKLPVEKPRGSLRRRFLLILLVMSTVPGFAALILLWLMASRTLETNLREETYERSRVLALEMDRMLSGLMGPLEGAAEDKEFALRVRELIERRRLGLEDDARELDEWLLKRPSSFEGLPFYVIDGRGRVLAQVEEARILFKVPRPTPLDGTGVLDKLEKGALPEGLFVAEPETQDWSDPVLIAGAPIPELGDGADGPMDLITLVPMMPIFREVESKNTNFGQRLIVLSRQSGVIYSTQGDADFELALNRERGKMFREVPEEGDELRIVTVRSQDLGIAGSEVRTLGQYSKTGGLEPVEWLVVQAVDLEEALSTIRPMFWATVIMGLVLAVFALVLAITVSGRMVRPILELTRGMQRYSQGDLDYRVEVNSGDEIEVLANAANNMAESLRVSYEDLAQRMHELDAKARQLELIHSISYSVNRVLDLERLFERIIKELRDHIQAERFSLALLNEKRDRLAIEFIYPRERSELPSGTEIPMKDSVMGRALKDQALTLRRLRPEGKFFEDNVLYPLGMKLLCVVPLVANNGPVGTLNLASEDEKAFDNQRIKLLERIADTLALAVEHGRLFRRVARFAEELEEKVEQRTKELKDAQARLVQTEKFAATGSIAAHIGHEVNNPLSIIKNYLKIVRGRVSKSAAAQEDIAASREGLEVIEEEIDRIARIISQLRQVSKPTKAEARDLDINAEIAKLTDLFQGTSRKRGIDIRIETDPSLGVVRLCGDYLRQIVINLVRNSMDAMEDYSGGMITIRTVRGKPSSKFLCVEVQDTGSGIPEDLINKVFDPFFTTKGEGKGTGLGLSVSFGLAQTMGGTLEAESEMGKGTTMRLILPLETIHDDDGSDAESTDSDGAPTEEEKPVVRREGQKIIIG